MTHRVTQSPGVDLEELGGGGVAAGGRQGVSHPHSLGPSYIGEGQNGSRDDLSIVQHGNGLCRCNPANSSSESK